jgi:hypothetical protein
LEQAEPATLPKMLIEKELVIQEEILVLEQEEAVIEAKEVIG